MIIRPATDADHPVVVSVVDQWWGRPMAAMLPRLFFTHFADTSSIAEEHKHSLAGFLAGFISQTAPETAYIHFVGVAPQHRRIGLASTLYERFFAEVSHRGCSEVRSLTGPGNTTSIAFHKAMGFDIMPGESAESGISVHRDYDGPGQDRVLFARTLA